MAEARSAVIVIEQQKRGIRLSSTNEGIEVTILIPNFRHILRLITSAYKNLKNSILYSFWPAPPLVLGSVVSLVSYGVVFADRKSWWREGWLAHALWNIDSLFPWTKDLSVPLRVGYLAAIAAVIGMALIMITTRGILRLLLAYRGWLKLKPKEVSYVVKIWAICTKILLGRKPMLYSYQSSLPRMPVPALADTTKKFLSTVKPLLTSSEYENILSMSNDFQSTAGKKINFYLNLKSWWANNYVTDWWEKYVYLRGRDPIMINSNYYVLDQAYYKITGNQTARAANVCYQFMRFKDLLDEEKLEPMVMNGTVPLCMSQYERQFSTTRIPGKECDTLVHRYGKSSKHIAVLRKGNFYAVSMYRKDGSDITPLELEKQFAWIIKHADENPCTPQNGLNIAALTGTNRTEWAQFGEDFCSDDINKRSLDAIENAIFFLVLDETSPDTWTDKGRSLITGSGANRWFDKSLTLVAFANGSIGLNCEHAWADAPVNGHLWEYTLSNEYHSDSYDSNGACNVANVLNSAPATGTIIDPIQLKWDLPLAAREAVTKALLANQKLIDDFDLVVGCHEKYGKGLIKTFRCSPDSFVQMALQLAYYRQSNGKFAQTYESSMTRLYRDGRTETVRSVSEDSCAFVRAMENADIARKDVIKLLVKAADTHQTYARDCMSGEGVDRHLFAMYVCSVGLGIDAPFLKNALSMKWKLSTSQQPQSYVGWPKGTNPMHNLCPGKFIYFTLLFYRSLAHTC
jgi:carnitine O-palmitoyltransferase 1